MVIPPPLRLNSAIGFTDPMPHITGIRGHWRFPPLVDMVGELPLEPVTVM